jgi:hypothetical protein
VCINTLWRDRDILEGTVCRGELVAWVAGHGDARIAIHHEVLLTDLDLPGDEVNRQKTVGHEEGLALVGGRVVEFHTALVEVLNQTELVAQGRFIVLLE